MALAAAHPSLQPDPQYVFALQPTEDMPLATVPMQTIYETLHKDTTKSMFDLIELRSFLAQTLKVLVPVPGILVFNTTAMFLSQDPVVCKRLRRLCLMLPFELTKSLVRHTLAYDMMQSTRPETYSADAKGVYAVGISIKHRNGKFLTGNEICAIVLLIKAYADAAEVYFNNGKKWNPKDPSDDVHRIDEQFRSKLTGLDEPPRWANSASTIPKLRALVQVLEELAAAAARAGRLDVPLTQSPLMVGCTQRPIDETVRQHIPASGLHSTTATYGLMLCAIQFHGKGKIVPESIAVPILATCEPEDLADGERLVTTLAQSLVNQTSFNIIELGGTKDSSKVPDETAEVHVYLDNKWFKSQMRAYHVRVKERHEALKAYREILELGDTLPEGKGRLIAARDKLTDCQLELLAWDEKYEKLVAELDEAREIHAKIKYELKHVQMLIDLKKELQSCQFLEMGERLRHDDEMGRIGA